MAPYSDHHATIFLSGDAALQIESVRRRWDPAMAAQTDAHVTVIYPQEAPDASLLDERLRKAARVSEPFRLRLGRVACFGRPECGVYVEVEDLDDGLARLRARVLAPPFDPLDFPPHVTLVHPRTSDRAHEFWNSPRNAEFGEEFCVASVAITALDGRKCGTLSAYALG